MKIFLIGMMGAGKSSIGLILSKELERPFFDTDNLIDVNSYITNHGIKKFRLEETNQINKIVENNASCIISIGGGGILSNKNRNIMKKHFCIFLRASINNLINRIKAQNIDRPLVKFLDNGKIDKKYFSQIYKQREDYYLNLSDLIIDTDSYDPLTIAINIKDKIMKHEIIN